MASLLRSLKHNIFAVDMLFMMINMTFYLWALDLITTERISSLIMIFKIAFPDSEVDLGKELGIDNPPTIGDPELTAKQAYFAQ